jgi:hypothetical protein
LYNLPDAIKKGIERSLVQAENGQIKTYKEVKKILTCRFSLQKVKNDKG